MLGSGLGLGLGSGLGSGSGLGLGLGLGVNPNLTLTRRGGASTLEGASTVEGDRTPRLPEPMHPQNRQPAPDGVCYSFGERRHARSAISQRMRNLDWSTAQCRRNVHDGDGDCRPLDHTVCPRSCALVGLEFGLAS